MKIGATVAQTRSSSIDRSALIGRATMAGFVFLVAGGLWWAWLNRDAPVLQPEKGVGYGLGLTGALMMLALLLYPLRKRVRAMRTWGPASSWFRWHMILGILGPTLIVLHSDYSLQSTNATVALASMLTVAGSGVAGRYLYGRIHKGLYGQRLEARTLLDEAAGSRRRLRGVVASSEALASDLAAFETDALSPTTTLWAALGRALTIGGQIGRNRRLISARLDRELEQHPRTQDWTPDRLKERRTQELAQLTPYYAAVRRAATLGVYERLFSLWHVLHVPLFIILVLTAIIHVIAVHLY